MNNEEEYDYDEDYSEEEYEERRRREEEREIPTWSEEYLNTLGMSMRDFF